jgi:hypothetical protein
MLFGLSTAIESVFPGVFDPIGAVVFWVLAVPALLLASPLTSILWKLGLVTAPGWFAWPKLLGFVLAYVIWIAVLLGLAQTVQRLFASKIPAGSEW